MQADDVQVKDRTEVQVCDEFTAEWLDFHRVRLGLKGMIKWLATSQRKSRRRLRDQNTCWKNDDLGISNKWKCFGKIEERRGLITEIHILYAKHRGRPFDMHQGKKQT
jgi:hypothetical protein